MKSVFGSICFLVCTVWCAAVPPEVPTINKDKCSQPVGFITAQYWGTTNKGTFVVVGQNASGEYLSKAVITATGSIGYSHRRIFWYSDTATPGWFTTSTSAFQIGSCEDEFYQWVIAQPDENRTDLEELYDEYFPPVVPESRLPWDDDLDGDGRPDRYDLDSPHYIDYLEYCRENDLDALDLQDYQYWYEHGLEDYLAARDQYYDSDLDGFSDGYEIIHDTDMNDASSYPLGRPDMGTANQIMGGVDSAEPWRYEEYADGWSRGHVYDMGYDPFGDTPISVINEDFEGPPDWYGLDSSGDGINNGTKIELGQNPYEFNFQQGSHYVYDDNGGYWKYVGGVTDADFPFPDPPTLEEALEKYEDYVPDGDGNYTYNPGTFEFGDAEYDARLQKFEKIKFDVDSVRPVSERDYQVHFNIPIPGGSETYTIAVMPDTGTPGGAALDNLRRIIRALSAVVISYVFVKHIWTVIRQY